jgi:hypothetical protein
MQFAKAKDLVCDLEKQPFGAFRTRLRWRKMQLGFFRFSRPALVKKKTCRIGMLRAPMALESEIERQKHADD